MFQSLISLHLIFHFFLLLHFHHAISSNHCSWLSRLHSCMVLNQIVDSSCSTLPPNSTVLSTSSSLPAAFVQPYLHIQSDIQSSSTLLLLPQDAVATTAALQQVFSSETLECPFAHPQPLMINICLLNAKLIIFTICFLFLIIISSIPLILRG